MCWRIARRQLCLEQNGWEEGEGVRDIIGSQMAQSFVAIERPLVWEAFVKRRG